MGFDIKYFITAFPYLTIAAGSFIAIRQKASFRGNRLEGEQAVWFGMFIAGLGVLMIMRELARNKNATQHIKQQDEGQD